MRHKRAILVAGLFVAQAAVVHFVVGAEHLPPPPDLSKLPQRIEGWQGTADIPISALTLQQLGADRTLERSYFRAETGGTVDLFIAWFQSQRGGTTQPHSPKVCLPGSGWLPLDSRQIEISTSRGTIPVERYMIANHGVRAETLYWYQSPRRVLTSEWAAKFFTLADGIRDRRTDTAIVRVFMTLRPGQIESPEPVDFARAVYPFLRDRLPH